MKRVSFGFLVLEVMFMAFLCERALAEEPRTPAADVPFPRPFPFRRDLTACLPTTSSAVVGTAAALTNTWGGYDGAARTPLLSVGTELRVLPRVALIGGITYTSVNAANPGLRPQLGARVQLLEQASSGVDTSAALLFRQDRFTSEDGLFQGSIAVGRSFGETSAVVNVVYGQDGEGDDHEGEVRLAGVRRVLGGLHVGIEGRYMHALASTDPNRAAHGTPSMEAMAGPLIAYTAGNWALVAEVGVSSRRTSRLETGLAALTGLGTSF